MILRPATKVDAQKLFDWRNDPLTRGNSLNSAPLSWKHHIQWLTASLTSPDRDLLIAECQGKAVGTIRLDYSDIDCQLSWTVAPEWRQRGIGRRMVEMAVRRARIATLKAEIKMDNEPSLRIVRALGFSECERGDGLTVWKYTRKADEISNCSEAD
jgi:RimJ/RimL family protein N-acetyltransferase